MTDTKHTPGPWKVDVSSLKPDGTPYAYYIIEDAPDWNCIASTFVDANLANARLIAAAPDVLEALELILPLARGYRPAGQTDTAKRTCNSWIQAAEAAITKAKGQS